MDANGEATGNSYLNFDERTGWQLQYDVIKMENQSPDTNISPTSPPLQLLNSVPQSYSTPALNGNSTPKPYLKIVEQPAKNDQRFRYVVEGRSAGSIKGANSTTENNTFPTIEIVNYNKPVVVVVSCVTKDKPYRPHPHKVVGRDGGGLKYKDGICEVKINEAPFRVSFNNLGIQCTRKKDMEKVLKERRDLKVNPFNTPYLPDQKLDYELHVVRLCFQAFINPTGNSKSWIPLDPVVSDPIIDKKAISDLVICHLCSYSAKVNGGDHLILLCEKVDKNDIRVKFTEFDSQGAIKWYAYAEAQPQDIHKQFAIRFKTPRYEKTDITNPVKVFIQLERPSDRALSKPVEFEYSPDPGMRTFTRIRRKIKRKEELDIFQQILSLDSETTATKYSCPLETCNDDNETVSSDSSASKPNSSDTLNEYEAAIRRRMGNSETEPVEADDTTDDELIRPHEIDIEFEVPQINFPVADESTQTSTPMDEILKNQQLTLDNSRPLSAVDKITEWMRSSEFERTDSLTVENGDTISISPVTVVTNISAYSPSNFTTNSTTTDDDKTFAELMEQVAELDDMLSRRGTLEQIAEIDDFNSRRSTLEQITEISDVSSRRATLEHITELSDALSRRSTLDNSTVKEFPIRPKVDSNTSNAQTASAQPSVELDETFDETATYTSLKIALKNPIEIPTNKFAVETQRKFSDLSTTSVSTEEEMAGLIVLTNPPAPKIKVNAVQTPPSPPSPPLPLPPRTPSPGPDQKGPPLPPKRRVSHELNVSNNSTPSSSFKRTERNGSLPGRPPSQIIIMRTPEQSPTKRSSASPTPTASPKKKQDTFKRKRLRSSQDVRDYMQTQMKCSENSNGQFQAYSPTNFANNFGATASNFSPELKVEQRTPEYYGNQNSPYSMVASPHPQSPLGVGLHYTNLTPNKNNTNPFLEPVTTNILPLQPIDNHQLPSTSGGSFTYLKTADTTNFNIQPILEPMDSSEATSEGRLVTKLANQLEAEANAVSNNFIFNILNTAQFEVVNDDEVLTTSGLINALGNTDLSQIANLSLSENT